MTTLSIGKAQRAIGAYFHPSNVGTGQGPSALSRFAPAAQVWAEKYDEYKYNETEWQALRF